MAELIGAILVYAMELLGWVVVLAMFAAAVAIAIYLLWGGKIYGLSSSRDEVDEWVESQLPPEELARIRTLAKAHRRQGPTWTHLDSLEEWFDDRGWGHVGGAVAFLILVAEAILFMSILFYGVERVLRELGITLD